MNISDKIKALRDLVAAPVIDPNAPVGKGQHRNEEQDILGYLLALYFLSKYKFFDDRGFTDYKDDMVYFRNMADYSDPFFQMYKDLIGQPKADKLLEDLENLGKLARTLSFRPLLAKNAFRALKMQSAQVPHARLKQFIRSLSHYFEQGSKADVALEKAMIAEVSGIIKHFRMKRMMSKIENNLDQIVLAGDLYQDEDVSVIDQPAQPDQPAPVVAPPPPTPPKSRIYTLDDLKKMNRMELLNFIRESTDEKSFALVIQATDDKVALPYLANSKSYFTSDALEKYKKVGIYKRAWVRNLKPDAKLALIKLHSFVPGGGQELWDDVYYATAVLGEATETIVHRWLEAGFRYERGRFKSEPVIETFEKLFKSNPALLSKRTIELLLKSPFLKEHAIRNWLPESNISELLQSDPNAPTLDHEKAALIRTVLPRLDPAVAVKVLDENIWRTEPGFFGDIESLPELWRVICRVKKNQRFTVWREYQDGCVSFLSDSDLVTKYKDQAQILVSALRIDPKLYVTSYEKSPLFSEIYQSFPKCRPALLQHASPEQLFSLSKQDSDEEALKLIHEIQTDELNKQKAWWAANYTAGDEDIKGNGWFEEASSQAPAAEIPHLFDAACKRNLYMAKDYLVKRMPEEFIHKVIETDIASTTREQAARRMPPANWTQFIDTKRGEVQSWLVQYCEPSLLPTVVDRPDYLIDRDLVIKAVDRMSTDDALEFWENKAKAKADTGEMFWIFPELIKKLPELFLSDLLQHFPNVSEESQLVLAQRLPVKQLKDLFRQAQTWDVRAEILKRLPQKDFLKFYQEHIAKDRTTKFSKSLLHILLERLESTELPELVPIVQRSSGDANLICSLYKKLSSVEAEKFGIWVMSNYRNYTYTTDEIDRIKFTKACLIPEELEKLAVNVVDTYDLDSLRKEAAKDRVEQFLNSLQEAKKSGDLSSFVEQLLAQIDSGDPSVKTFADQAVTAIFAQENRAILNALLSVAHPKFIAIALKKLDIAYVLDYIPPNEISAQFSTLFAKLMPKEVEDPNHWDLDDKQTSFLKNAPASKLIEFYSWAYEKSVMPKKMQEILISRLPEWKSEFKKFFLMPGRDLRRRRWVEGSFSLILAADDADILGRVQKTRGGRDIKIGTKGDIHAHYKELAPLHREKFLNDLKDRVLVEKLFFGELSELIPLNTKVEQALSISTSKGGTNEFIDKIKNKFKETSLTVATWEILRYKTLDEVKAYIKSDPLSILEFSRPAQAGNTTLDSIDANLQKELQDKLRKDWDLQTHTFKGTIKAAYTVKMRAGMKKAKSNTVMMLYHGTSYYAAGFILQNGFRVLKNYTTGRMLGDGIYFTDISSKAAQYVSSKGKGGFGRHDDEGVMLVCEVDLGNMITLTNANYYQEYKDWNSHGYDSVFAPKGVSGLQNNEYVVADVSRIRVAYVLDLTRSTT